MAPKCVSQAVFDTGVKRERVRVCIEQKSDADLKPRLSICWNAASARCLSLPGSRRNRNSMYSLRRAA
jgi:hypothetical protein